MIDWLFSKLAAAWHRRRLLRGKPDPWITEFREMFPGRCVVCSYTDWANQQGASIKPIAHRCIEGRSDGPPQKPPAARVVRR